MMLKEKIRIIDVHVNDSFYKFKAQLVGQEGILTQKSSPNPELSKKGWTAGNITFKTNPMYKNGDSSVFFYAIQYIAQTQTFMQKIIGYFKK